MAKPKTRPPLSKTKIDKRLRKKARKNKVRKLKGNTLRAKDDKHREEVFALLEAFKDNVPVSDMNRREIRCGSDCSGLGCDLVALDKLGMSKFCKPVFWCENDAVKQGIYKTVSKHLGIPVSHMYPDIVDRNNDTAEDCDLYISGFPCPSFSALGKRLGTQDSRGQVGYNCLMYVIRKRPCVVIFENVRGLLHVRHRPFLDCMKKVLNDCHYRTWLKVLDTKQLGIPHSRPRVYIVAIQDSNLRNKFKWPKPVPFHKSMLGEIIDKNIRGNEVLEIPHYEKKYGKKEVWTLPYILDVDSSPGFQSALKACAPCLTYTRLKNAIPGYYLPALRRRLSMMEAGRLQGLPDDLIKALLAHHAPQDVGAAFGDGMSINVLCKVLIAAFIAVGVLNERDRNDRDSWRR